MRLHDDVIIVRARGSLVAVSILAGGQCGGRNWGSLRREGGDCISRGQRGRRDKVDVGTRRGRGWLRFLVPGG